MGYPEISTMYSAIHQFNTQHPKQQISNLNDFELGNLYFVEWNKHPRELQVKDKRGFIGFITKIAFYILECFKFAYIKNFQEYKDNRIGDRILIGGKRVDPGLKALSLKLSGTEPLIQEDNEKANDEHDEFYGEVYFQLGELYETDVQLDEKNKNTYLNKAFRCYLTAGDKEHSGATQRALFFIEKDGDIVVPDFFDQQNMQEMGHNFEKGLRHFNKNLRSSRIFFEKLSQVQSGNKSI